MYNHRLNQIDTPRTGRNTTRLKYGSNLLCLPLKTVIALAIFSSSSAVLAQSVPTVSIPDYQVDESADSVVLTTTLSEPSDRTIRVSFTSRDGTAKQDDDYSHVRQWHTFRPGQLVKEVTIPILQDNIVEGEEHFQVDLSVWRDFDKDTDTVSSTITINDDDQIQDRPTVSIPDYQVNESDGSVVLTTTLSEPSDRTIRVSFTTRDGTAKQAEDYDYVRQWHTFRPGQLVKEVTIPILQDSLVEGEESFQVDLSVWRDADKDTDVISSTITISDDWTFEDSVLNRLSYGPTNKSRTQLRELGIYSYVQRQLDVDLPATRCVDASGNSACPPVHAQLHKVKRAAFSDDTQLLEILEDFWFNHFNVNARIGVPRAVLGSQIENVIRQNLTGNFSDLLIAVARSPAMLAYLNNNTNVNGAPNENYARELLELHTVGVGAGYTDDAVIVIDENGNATRTDDDVINIAKLFTGWTTPRDACKAKMADDCGQKDDRSFTFDATLHDSTASAIFANSPLPEFNYNQDNGAEDEGVRFLQQLAGSHATSTFITTKLAQRFIDESITKDSPIVRLSAELWRKTGGDLKAVYLHMLTRQDAYSRSLRNTKIKSPLRFLASAARATNLWSRFSYNHIDSNIYNLKNIEPKQFNPWLLSGAMILQGQSMYEVAPPTGYPEETDFWVSSGSMVTRLSLLRHIVSQPKWLEGVVVDSDLRRDAMVKAILSQLTIPDLSHNTLQAIKAQVAGLPADKQLSQGQTNTLKIHVLTLAFNSPEFMRY